MPDGGRLTIETENVRLDQTYARRNDDVAAGDYVAISVSDTGVGMPPDVAARAFDPFFTTKPTGLGTGLGLSMIYGFAKQSRGHVRIYSEVGKGTTIKLYLSRATGDVTDANDVRDSEVPRGHGERILVVEDDDTVRQLVVDVLREWGYQQLEASDARTAIPILHSKRRIDLLVTDVGLPYTNGRQLAEMARETRPDLKVLFVTGYAENVAVRGGSSAWDRHSFQTFHHGCACGQNVRQPGPGRAEPWSRRHHEQHRKRPEVWDQTVQQLQAGWVNPVHVLEQDEHRPQLSHLRKLARKCLNQMLLAWLAQARSWCFR